MTGHKQEGLVIAGSAQNKDFVRDLISDCLLDEAVSWISSNMEPHEIFSLSSMEEWAEANGYIKSED